MADHGVWFEQKPRFVLICPLCRKDAVLGYNMDPPALTEALVRQHLDEHRWWNWAGILLRHPLRTKRAVRVVLARRAAKHKQWQYGAEPEKTTKGEKR